MGGNLPDDVKYGSPHHASQSQGFKCSNHCHHRTKRQFPQTPTLMKGHHQSLEFFCKMRAVSSSSKRYHLRLVTGSDSGSAEVQRGSQMGSTESALAI